MGLLWCAECGERLACRRKRQTNREDRYVCQGRRLWGCRMPTIPRPLLDDALAQHFVSTYVVDTEESVRRERDRLTALRSSEADLGRDELDEVERDLDRILALRRRALADYEASDLAAKQWSRLDDDYDARERHARAAQDRLRSKLAQVEGSIPVADLDAILDRLSAVRRMIAGALDAGDVPRMNARLCRVFDSLVVSRRGEKLLVDPKLRPDFLGESPRTATPHTFDFGDDRSPGVEIAESAPPAVELRRVELTSSDGRDDPFSRS